PVEDDAAQGGQGGALPEGPPEAPVAQLDFDIKELVFSWGETERAESYRVERKVDGDWHLEAETEDLTAEVAIALHLFDWKSTEFRVSACNADGCTAGEPIDATSAHLESIGYVKSASVSSADVFGFIVALDDTGTTLAVGRSAGVDVYHRDAAGWSFWQSIQEPLFANMTLSPDGTRVAIATGDTYCSVHIYANIDGAWTWVRSFNKLVNTRCGALKLSAANDTLALGVPDGIPGIPLSGGAIGMYTRSAVVVIHDPLGDEPSYFTIGYPMDRAGSEFGASVAFDASGTRLAVGAPYENSVATGINGPMVDASATKDGAVFVYDLADDEWSRSAFIKSSVRLLDDWFGWAVAFSDDGKTLAVGAVNAGGDSAGIDASPGEASPAASGSVWLFHEAEGDWYQDLLIKAPTLHQGASFGGSLALSADGKTLAVGAPGDKGVDEGLLGDPLHADQSIGAVHVYRKPASHWVAVSYVKPIVSRVGMTFAHAVDLSADGLTLAVGAPYEEGRGTGLAADPTVLGATTTGAVYLY
ncbi:MAG TPA: hypothetical protein VLC09_12480, partial [Polyangiaceae bacterium]|nr:hypothetical protein [Polyangiaceae bacterium]